MKLRNTKVKLGFAFYLHKILTSYLSFFFFQPRTKLQLPVSLRRTVSNPTPTISATPLMTRNWQTSLKLATRPSWKEPSTRLSNGLTFLRKVRRKNMKINKKNLSRLRSMFIFYFFFFLLIHTLFLSPIMQKLYSAAGGVPGGAGGASGAGGAPGGFPGASQEGPSVEEVD